MPNWCSNSMTLRHDDPEMIQRAYKAFVDGKFCEEFDPCPQELKDTSSPNRVNADQLVEKYGYADWYSFQVNEWGTKWDFGSGDGINHFTENELVVYFDSAWSPPITMMEKLEELGFTVDLMYNESGMAFCGRYSDGYDDYYELSGMDSEEVAANIPEDIDQAFCISQNMAEWESENEDES